MICLHSHSSVTSILFPIFASYKALRTTDPALLKPWLMYWTTLSLFLMAESTFYWILCWIPFYSWIRLGVHLYLVLPGQQGSVFLYQQHIHPFLEEHERQIDRFISEGHEKAKAAGLQYLKDAMEYVRVNVMHQQPRQATPPTSRNVSYSSALLSRFNMPSARDGLATAGTTDLFSLLGNALHQTTYATSTSRDAQAEDLAASGTLIPPHMAGAERSDYVNTQRERLRTLLQAFDQESFNEDMGAASGASRRHSPPRYPSSRKSYLQPQEGLSKSRSESEFEDLGYETMPDPEQYKAHAPEKPSKNSPGWSNWIWGNYGEENSAVNPRKDL